MSARPAVGRDLGLVAATITAEASRRFAMLVAEGPAEAVAAELGLVRSLACLAEALGGSGVVADVDAILPPPWAPREVRR